MKMILESAQRDPEKDHSRPSDDNLTRIKQISIVNWSFIQSVHVIREQTANVSVVLKHVHFSQYISLYMLLNNLNNKYDAIAMCRYDK